MNFMDAMPGEKCSRCDLLAIGAVMTGSGKKLQRTAVCRVHLPELEAEDAART